MSHYHHLSISERESIWENKILGKSLRQIAEITGRSVSTLSRELRRNKGSHRRYQPSEAQKHYEKRRKRCHRRRILEQGELRDTVAALLTEQQWSPEQISERLALERGGPAVSYATIYRTLRSGWMEPKGTKRNRHGRYPMQKHLRRKGHKRKAPVRKRNILFIKPLKIALWRPKPGSKWGIGKAIWSTAVSTKSISSPL